MMDKVSILVSCRTLELLTKVDEKWRKEKGFAEQDANFMIRTLAEKELGLDKGVKDGQKRK